jgi:AdoMet-dependent rRNA methyltransferase SPB1
VKRGGFEVVPAKVDYEREQALRALDDVEIGSKEHAELLAMGEMMFSQSKARDLMDASYNKYMFPERDEDLPSWFVEDQRKNNRPQLPITREMVQRIRKQYQDLAEKPIKKVAEARARKKKKKVEQLIKAKRKAQAILDSNDISNFSKMKAVAKAYKGVKVKRPSKTYVVGSKKGQRGGYNVKFVDKRVKSDKRAMKKAAKGGKKRRSVTKKRQKKRRKR